MGDELTLLVIRVDPNERRIGLSPQGARARDRATSPMPADVGRGRGAEGTQAARRDDDYDDEE